MVSFICGAQGAHEDQPRFPEYPDSQENKHEHSYHLLTETKRSDSKWLTPEPLRKLMGWILNVLTPPTLPP